MFSFLKQKEKYPEGLVPRIRPAWWFESFALNTFKMSEAQPKDFFGTFDVFYGPYDADLAVGFGIDQGNIVQSVRNCDVKEWGLSYEELLEIAKNNLLKQEPFFKKFYDGVWVSTLVNTCDSALMLFKDEILKLELLGDPVVFLGTRDSLLVTGKNDVAGLQCIMDSLLDKYEHVISTSRYMIVNGEWMSVSINAENDIIKEYLSFAHNLKERNTNEFLENIESIHTDVSSDDLLVARMAFGYQNNDPFTFSTWVETKTNWVPKVDRLIVAPWNSRNTNENASEKELDLILDELTFDWEVVTQVCAANMKQLDFFHEIWEFQEFPTDAEIEKMKMLRTERAK